MRSIPILFAVLGLAACGTDSTSDDDDDDDVPTQVTWYRDVAPILSEHCMSCHQEGGIAPFTLTEYASAVEMSGLALDAITRGVMPPFDAREEADCTPRFGWVDDPRLSNTERETLEKWVEQGHPLGEEIAIPDIPVTNLTTATMRLTPTEGFATSGDRDQFICFVLDPGNTQLQWLTGLQVLPDIAEVVHHAVITEIAPGAAQDELVARAGGIGKPFECGTTSTSDFVVHIWTPGNQPMSTSDEIAVPVVAGAKLVMQIHYHPAGVAHAPDKTAVDLRFSSTWPTRMYFVTAFGNSADAPTLLPGPGDGGQPQFLIPRNVQEHPEHMRVTIPSLGDLTDVRLFSANPHMHLVGTHISSTIERPAARGNDPQTECLANGGWNFDWQRTYQYDAPLDDLPSIAEGDVIDIKCTWDNTIENPFVQRMLADAGLPPFPIDITLGEETTNEMCLEIFGLSIPAPAPPSKTQPRPTTIEFPPALAQMRVNPNMLN